MVFRKSDSYCDLFGKMGENSASFVEWKEEFVSRERGKRIVHYILKDSCGNSILAVVGTERSLRHMVYVVAEEFLNCSDSDNPIQAGFKWRSRREVVDWLTSLLAKQQQAGDPLVLVSLTCVFDVLVYVFYCFSNF